jgi:Xaa-Pro aminopeptidase
MNLKTWIHQASSEASKINQIPGLHFLARGVNRESTHEELMGYLRCQNLAIQGAKTISEMMQEGWTEIQAAELLDTYLRDNGVHSYFHKPYVWFGDRTRFAAVNSYWDYMPSMRVLKANDVAILDVAPILDGYIADIGYSVVRGAQQSEAVSKAFALLDNLRQEIPQIFVNATNGAEVWGEVDRRIIEAGFENIHKTYPFGVLGHRVHKVALSQIPASFINFGWHSYWSFLSRGLFGQLLNQDFKGDLKGLWAVEPHVGGEGFGIKFEEILVVDVQGAYWLGDSSLA